MIRDPIVDEVRAIRDQIAKENDYDLKKIVESIRKNAAKFPGQRVVRSPKRPKPKADTVPPGEPGPDKVSGS